MPKVSRYNHVWPLDNEYHIAYNACTGTVGLMTRANHNTYTSLLEKLVEGPTASLSEAEKELLAQLEAGRFVVPDNFDERADLLRKHNIDKYDRSRLSLSLAPTMGCNMACPYCYESNKSGRMSDDIVSEVVQFVEHQTVKIRELDVGWYGGEPLLAMDIIEKLSHSFIELSSRYSFQYGASMITNGYLLTPRIIDRLIDLKVNSVQVCLDGPARVHDKRRPLKSGESGFDKILSNVCYAADRVWLGVRVNIDREFRREWVVELLNILRDRGLHEKTIVYFGYVNVASPACANIADTCYNMDEFASLQVEYSQLLLDRGFRVDNEPSPKSVVCMGQSLNSFLIDPSGYVYRCIVHAGDTSRSIGVIHDRIDYQHPNFTKLFDPVPFDDPTCFECDLLPVCMGGCPGQKADRQLPGIQLCAGWKAHFRPLLEIVAKAKLKEMQTVEETATD